MDEEQELMDFLVGEGVIESDTSSTDPPPVSDDEDFLSFLETEGILPSTPNKDIRQRVAPTPLQPEFSTEPSREEKDIAELARRNPGTALASLARTVITGEQERVPGSLPLEPEVIKGQLNEMAPYIDGFTATKKSFDRNESRAQELGYSSAVEMFRDVKMDDDIIDKLLTIDPSKLKGARSVALQDDERGEITGSPPPNLKALMPKATPGERLEAYFNLLVSEYNQLSNETKRTFEGGEADTAKEKIFGAEPISDAEWFESDGSLLKDIDSGIDNLIRNYDFRTGDYTLPEKRMIQVLGELRALAPLVKEGKLAQDVNKGLEGRRFAKKFRSSLTGEHTQLGDETPDFLAQMTQQALINAGVEVDDRSAEAIQKEQEQEPWSVRSTIDMGAMVAAIGTQMAATNPLSNQVTKPLRALGTIQKSTKLGRFALRTGSSMLDAGVRYEIAGQLGAEGLKEELSFRSGLYGGAGSALISAPFRPLLNKMTSNFGQFAARRIGAGIGETGEEIAQEWTQTVERNDEDYERAYTEFKQNFGDLSHASFFFVSTFMMGMVMGGSDAAMEQKEILSAAAQQAYNRIPTKERAVVDAAIKEWNQAVWDGRLPEAVEEVATEGVEETGPDTQEGEAQAEEGAAEVPIDNSADGIRQKLKDAFGKIPEELNNLSDEELAAAWEKLSGAEDTTSETSPESEEDAAVPEEPKAEVEKPKKPRRKRVKKATQAPITEPPAEISPDTPADTSTETSVDETPAAETPIVNPPADTSAESTTSEDSGGPSVRIKNTREELSRQGVDIDDKGNPTIRKSEVEEVVGDREYAVLIADNINEEVSKLGESTEEQALARKLDKLEKSLRDGTFGKEPAAESTTEEVVEEDAVEPVQYERQQKALQKLGIPPEKTQAMVKASNIIRSLGKKKFEKLSEEDRAIVEQSLADYKENATAIGKARGAKNSLVSEFERLVVNHPSVRTSEKTNRRTAYIPIQDEMNPPSGGVKQIVKDRVKGRSKAHAALKNQLKKVKDTFLSKQIASAPKARKALKELINQSPPVKEYHDALVAEITALPSVTPESAATLGYKSEKDMAEAIASQIMFNPGVTAQGNIRPTGDKAGKSDAASFNQKGHSYQLPHFADSVAKEVERSIEETSLSEDWLSLADYASQDFGGSVDPGRETTVVRATRAMMDSMIQHFQGLFPGLEGNIFYQDQQQFDGVARSLGRDPAITKGIYSNGAIYLNPAKITQDTLTHELAHIWLFVFRNSHPSAYATMELLAQKDPIYQEVKSRYESVMSKEEIGLEALAQITGEAVAKEYIRKSDLGPMGRAIERVFDFLRKALNLPRNIFRKKKTSAGPMWSTPLDLGKAKLPEFLSMAAREILSGAQLTTMTDLGLPEFQHTNLINTSILNNSEETYWNRVHLSFRDFEVSVLGRTGKLRSHFQNERIMLDNVQEAIKSREGGTLNDKFDILGDFDLLSGKVKHVMDQMITKLVGNPNKRFYLQRKKGFDASIMGRAQRDGIKWNDLSLYMYARHAVERNDRARELSLERGDVDIVVDGSGMTDREANAVLAKLTNPLYASYAAEIDAIIAQMRDIMLEGGLINSDQKTALEDSFRNYVPLLVKDYFAAGNTDHVVSTKAGSVPSSGVKRIKATSKYRYFKRMDVISAVIGEFRRQATLAERNKALNAFADMVEKYENKGLWEVRKSKLVPTFDKDGDITFFKNTDPKLDPGEYAVAFMRDGKLHHIILRDKELYQALVPPSTAALQANKVFSFIRGFQSFRRAALTIFNVSFGAANFAADTLFSMGFIDAVVDGKNLQVKLAKNIARAFKAQGKREFGLGIDDRWDQYLEEQMEDGGFISWVNYSDAENAFKRQERFIKGTKWTSTKGKVIRYGLASAQGIAQSILLYNSLLEQTVRSAAYITAREEGMSRKKAALAAKNITVNFNNKGRQTWWMNTLYLFSNAGVQGTFMMYDYARSSPKVRRNLGVILGLSILVNAFNDMIAAGLDDEDRATDIISNDERRTVLHMRVSKDYTLKTRLPYGANLVKVMGDQMYDAMRKKTDVGSAFAEVFKTAVSTFSPLPTDRGLTYMALPDVFKMPYELETNETYGGVPIAKEDLFGPKGRASQQHFSSVSRPSKAFTDWLAKATGGEEGSELHAGIEMNPEHIDYGLSYLFGGAGRSVLNTIDTFFPEEEVNINKVPVVRRFVENLQKVEFRETQILEGAYKESPEKKFNKHQLENIRYSYKKLTKRALDNGETKKLKYIQNKYKKIVELQTERYKKTKEKLPINMYK